MWQLQLQCDSHADPNRARYCCCISSDPSAASMSLEFPSEIHASITVNRTQGRGNAGAEYVDGRVRSSTVSIAVIGQHG